MYTIITKVVLLVSTIFLIVLVHPSTSKTDEIDEVYLCGVSTDLVVQSAARDAHDRDYKVTILKDCCAAANDEDHNSSLSTLEKIAIVENSTEVFN